MRRSKEIMVLLALLLSAMAFVLWYVIDRRARNRAAATPPPIVTLGGANERQTIDFSSGQAVVRNTPEDQAAVDAALRDIAAATQGVTFPPTPKTPAPAPAAPAPAPLTPTP